MANRNFIRRKVPFVDKIKLVKPIEIEGYKEEKNMVAITECLSSITEIYKFKFRIGQCWGLVYAAEPEKILDFMKFHRTKRIEIENIDED